MEKIELYNEDCQTTMSRIETGSVDLIVTDPPYNITACEWDEPIDIDMIVNQWNRIIKDNGVIAVTSKQPFSTDLINANRRYFRYEIIWDKGMFTNFHHANKMPLSCHENVLIFYKSLPTYNPQKWKSTPYRKKQSKNGHTSGNTVIVKNRITYDSDGDRYPMSIIHFPHEPERFNTSKQKQDRHPTQKPLNLFRWLIRTYTNPRDLIFDGYSGSGTTAHACIKEGRRFIGSELNKEYFDKAQKRINDAQKQLSLFSA